MTFPNWQGSWLDNSYLYLWGKDVRADYGFTDFLS